MINLANFTIFVIVSLLLGLFFCLADGYILFSFKDGFLSLLAKEALSWKEYLRLGANFVFMIWLGASQYKFMNGIKFNFRG